MKTIISLFAMSLLATAGRAQFWSLPPSSSSDSIVVHDIGNNAGLDHWNSQAGLGAYEASGNGNSNRISPGVPDSSLGLVWQNTAPSNLTSAKTAVNASGGVVRAIFVGETAGWLNDFGYTYSGDPTVKSFTQFTNIDSSGPSANVHFGQYIDIPLLAGDASTFDFWLNGKGATGLNAPGGPSAHGGIYTLFNPANGSPGTSNSQFLWAQSPITVNTYVPSLGVYQGVDTYIVSAEDWRLNAGSDRDFSDYRFALQFFGADGMPLGGAVPEPGTYSLILGVVILGLTIAVRQRRIALS